MGIGKYFSSSKKRDLSDDSKEATDPKKAKEATPSSSYGDHDVFEEGLHFSNCRSTLFDCLKNLESKVNKIFANTNTLNKNQIKGEKQLTDLTETVNFLSEMFHEFEANRKLKEEIIKSLRGQVSALYDDLKKTKAQVDQQAQYSPRHCLLFHGIKEEKGEDTDSIIINTVKEEMDIEILPNDLDRSHRNGNPKTKKKERLIKVKFVKYNLRHNIFKNKKLLKGKRVSITKSLTKDRMAKLNEARETYGFRNVWTSDGKIVFKDEKTPSSKPLVYSD